jgi:uncharacterized membrane protein YgcG
MIIRIRIEVGYGLEGAIPDVTAKSIIDNDLTPNFRAGNFYRGIDDATDDIIKAAAGEYKAPAGYNKKGGKGLPIGGIIIFLIILFTIFGSRGGGRGGMMSRRGYGNFGPARSSEVCWVEEEVVVGVQAVAVVGPVVAEVLVDLVVAVAVAVVPAGDGSEW